MKNNIILHTLLSGLLISTSTIVSMNKPECMHNLSFQKIEDLNPIGCITDIQNNFIICCTLKSNPNVIETYKVTGKTFSENLTSYQWDLQKPILETSAFSLLNIDMGNGTAISTNHEGGLHKVLFTPPNNRDFNNIPPILQNLLKSTNPIIITPDITQKPIISTQKETSNLSNQEDKSAKKSKLNTSKSFKFNHRNIFFNSLGKISFIVLAIIACYNHDKIFNPELLNNIKNRMPDFSGLADSIKNRAYNITPAQ